MGGGSALKALYSRRVLNFPKSFDSHIRCSIGFPRYLSALMRWPNFITASNRSSFLFLGRVLYFIPKNSWSWIILERPHILCNVSDGVIKHGLDAARASQASIMGYKEPSTLATVPVNKEYRCHSWDTTIIGSLETRWRSREKRLSIHGSMLHSRRFHCWTFMSITKSLFDKTNSTPNESSIYRQYVTTMITGSQRS